MVKYNILLKRPHLLESFLYCKRQFYFESIGFYNQDNTRVLIGRAYHDEKEQKHFYPVKVDKMDWKKGLIIEFKKRDFGLPAIMQTYLYLKIMQKYNPKIKKAIITSIEKHKKKEISYPNEKYEQVLNNAIEEIASINSIPERKPKKSMCKNCSLFEYCWVE